MFFKKSKKHPLSDPVNGMRSVCILGEGPLALYLGAKIKLSGINVIRIAAHCEDKTFTLKEEYNLQKNSFCLPSVNIIKEEPQLIVIASEACTLKSNLTLLSALRFPDAPVLCFSRLENYEIIRPLLGRNFIKAYFHGYLSLDGSTLTAFSPVPQITLTADDDEDKLRNFDGIFAQSGIKILKRNNDRLNFWEDFAPHALGYLLSFSKKHITEQLDDKEHKPEIVAAAEEICRLAANEQINLSAEEIIKQLWETPHDFRFRKDRSRTQEAAELDYCYTLLTDKARTCKCKMPFISRLMKNGYDKLLKK